MKRALLALSGVVKKRLMMALAAGALVAAMLPAVGSATGDPCAATDPTVSQLSQCVTATQAELKEIYKEMRQTSRELQRMLKKIDRGDGSISVGDLFEIQLLMRRLSQLSESSTSVVSASNTAISSMARNVKG